MSIGLHQLREISMILSDIELYNQENVQENDVSTICFSEYLTGFPRELASKLHCYAKKDSNFFVLLFIILRNNQ